jgi:enoyl-CoA hydratase/carnithine racemase
VTDAAPASGSAIPVVEWSATGQQTFAIQLGHPPVNALSSALLDGLDAALDEFDRSSARVVVIASAVPGFFAAGADIKTMANIDRDGFVAYGKHVRSVIERLAALDRPSIAAIEGRALGGGMELALACSLRVVGAAAQFGLPEAKIGLIPSAGGTQRLPRYVGRGRALDLMLTARSVGGDEALRIGLADRVVPEGQARESALALAAQLASLSRSALRDVIRCVDNSFDLPLEQGLAEEVSRVEGLFDGPDGLEGMRAFLEKRPPRFS